MKALADGRFASHIGEGRKSSHLDHRHHKRGPGRSGGHSELSQASVACGRKQIYSERSGQSRAHT